MVEISTVHGRPSVIDEQEYADRLAILTAAKGGDRRAIQTLADRYHVRVGGVDPVERRAPSCTTMERETTMGDMATCEICGAKVKGRGLGVHKARKHGKSNGHGVVVPSSTPTGNNHDCDSCLLRGLDRAIDRELIRRAVMAGMALDTACAFVREAKAALVT